MANSMTTGSLLQGRYRILRTLRDAEDVCVHVAEDTRTPGCQVLLQEIVPCPALGPEALAKRIREAQQLVLIIDSLQHPAFTQLATAFSENTREYVVTEYVEGVTLEALSQMSMNGVPEKQALEWAAFVCQAMRQLHERPRPLVLDSLSPASLVLTPQGQLRMVDYGLARLFREEESPAILEGPPPETSKDLIRFGRLVHFLLTRQYPEELKPDQDAGLRTDIQRVVRKCLQGEAPQGYCSFAEVESDIEALLHPPPPSEPSPSQDTPPVPGRSRLGGLWPQSPRIRIAASAGLCLLLGVAAWMMSSGTNARKGPQGFLLSSGQKMLVVAGGRVTHRVPLSYEAGDIAGEPAGGHVFVGDSRGGRIQVLDARAPGQAEGAPWIDVESAPTRLVTDDQGTNLYALHPTTGKVSRIDLTSQPPRVSALLSVGRAPSNLASSPGSRLLFVASASDKTILILQSDGNKSFGTVEVGATPVAMACSPDSKELWVACQSPDRLAIVDVATATVTETIPEAAGSAPVDLAMTADGSRVLVLHQGSQDVTFVTRASRKAGTRLPVGARPQRLLLAPTGDAAWVTCAGSDSLDLINLATETPTGTVPVGAPAGMGTILP